MQKIILVLWITQGLLMVFDEFKFHRQRGLNKWERLGHPIDSLFFLIPFVYTQYFSNVNIFVFLSIFSCLLVTKDEFVHTEECDAGEQWLHSVLFIFHPIALFGLWLAWQNNFHTLIQIQGSVIFLFMLYQFSYWNFFVGRKNEA